MRDFRQFFKGKKITVMGLGLLGGIEDICFLAECGADLIVTDLKTKEELEPSLKALKKFKNIKYTLGQHDFTDFQNRDLIIKAPSTPLDSPYVAMARRHNIPVTMWAALFSKFAREIGAKIIGVTGTRGKTTTTAVIVDILKLANKKVITGGNIQGTSILSSLPKLTSDTVVVLELDSWKLQGFNDLEISPHISVFTTFLPDHLNYYKGNLKKYFADKAIIFKYQRKDDILILGSQALPFVKKFRGAIKSKIIIPKTRLPEGWQLFVPGEHNIYNATLAVAAVHQLGIKDSIIKKALKNFKGVEGRLQFLREIKGIEYYNDTNSTTPDATIVALKTLGHRMSKSKNIILIMGGSDKDLDFKNLFKNIQEYVKALILIPGHGTDRIIKDLQKLKVPIYENKTLKEILEKSIGVARRGDIILFSPAFTSFGMFKNEYDRGDQFVKLVKKLK